MEDIDLFRHSVRCGLFGTPVPRLRGLARRVDWDAMERLGRATKMMVHASEGVQRLGFEPPPHFLAAVAAYRQSVMRLNAFNLGSIAPVAAALHAGGFRFALFKGPVYQNIAYGDYFIRPATDIDVLVARADFAPASDRLRAIGYDLPEECDRLWWRHFLGEQHFFAADGTRATVDLHHRIQQPGCPPPRRTRLYLDDVQPVRLGGADIPFISPIHAALLASISLVKATTQHKHAAIYLADFCRLTAQLTREERQELSARAQRQGLTNTLRFAVHCGVALFELPPLDGLPPPLAKPALSGTDLLMALFDPDHPALRRPRLRALLWTLCDADAAVGKIGTYMSVGMNLMASKAARHWGRNADATG